jgi:hypothetical protein
LTGEAARYFESDGDDPSDIFETIQESSVVRPMLLDTALAGTRARRR